MKTILETDAIEVCYNGELIYIYSKDDPSMVYLKLEELKEIIRKIESPIITSPLAE